MTEINCSGSEKKNMQGMLAVRLTQEEDDMVKALKGHPHYVNIPQYIRDCIHHIYESKIKKAGRV